VLHYGCGQFPLYSPHIGNFFCVFGLPTLTIPAFFSCADVLFCRDFAVGWSCRYSPVAACSDQSGIVDTSDFGNPFSGHLVRAFYWVIFYAQFRFPFFAGADFSSHYTWDCSTFFVFEDVQCADVDPRQGRHVASRNDLGAISRYLAIVWTSHERFASKTVVLNSSFSISFFCAYILCALTDAQLKIFQRVEMVVATHGASRNEAAFPAVHVAVAPTRERCAQGSSSRPLSSALKVAPHADREGFLPSRAIAERIWAFLRSRSRI